MTPDEFNQRMTNMHGLISGDFAADTMAAPVAAILKAIKNRIVNSGLNTNEQQIGDYSTKPIYVTRDQFAKPGAFTATGKKQAQGYSTGGAVVYGGKQFKKFYGKDTLRGVGGSTFTQKKGAKKVMYLPQGYKQLRDIQGLRTDFVNSQYRGDLIRDYSMQKIAQSYVIGFTSAIESAKRQQMERKFGSPIYYPTQTEINNYYSAVGFTFDRLTRGVFETGEFIKPTVNEDVLVGGGLFNA